MEGIRHAEVERKSAYHDSGLAAPHLVLPTQPVTEPSSRVAVHRAVGLAHLPQPEVVGPPVQFLVQAAHQLLDIAQAPTSARLLADLAAEPLDLLRRRSRPDVGFARLRATQADRVTQEVKRLVGYFATPGLRLVDRQFQPGHHGPHRRHRLGGGAATTDHEVVRVVDDVSVEPALMPQHFPTEHETTHIQI
jgi:hypothetical protein